MKGRLETEVSIKRGPKGVRLTPEERRGRRGRESGEGSFPKEGCSLKNISTTPEIAGEHWGRKGRSTKKGGLEKIR